MKRAAMVVCLGGLPAILLALLSAVGDGSLGAASSPTAKVYWTAYVVPTDPYGEGTGKIQRANADGTDMEDLLTLPNNFLHDIDLDASGRKMYWIDGYGIHRANLDGTGVEDLITTGLVNPEFIALDVGGGKMYWTNHGTVSGTGSIRRANLHGSGLEDLITGLVWPEGIALDLEGGKVYWTSDWPARIHRANLDGTGVEELVGSGLLHPWDIEVDVGGGKMYWVDMAMSSPFISKVRRANLDGTGMEDLVSFDDDQNMALALDVNAGKMYWTHIDTGMVRRANLDGSNVEDLVDTGLHQLRGIALDVSPPALDTDGDGIPDTDDDCPSEREDPDGVEDDDGCPEALGQDGWADVGDLEDEAFHNLNLPEVWGDPQGPPDNPHVSSTGDSTKRYQDIGKANSLDLHPTMGGGSYFLLAEVEDGQCDDSYEILLGACGVDGEPVYRYKAVPDVPTTVKRLVVEVPDALIAGCTTVTFQNEAQDGCGNAAVYNARIENHRPVFGYLNSRDLPNLEGKRLTHVLEAFAYVDPDVPSYLNTWRDGELRRNEFVSAAESKGMIPMVSVFSDGASLKQVVGDAQKRPVLEDAIVDLVASADYKGVDIDAEALTAENELADFTAFVSSLRSKLENNPVTQSPRRVLTVAVQGDSLPHYPLGDLTGLVDYVSLMGYDYGWGELPLGPWTRPPWLYPPVRQHLEDIVETGYPAERAIYLLPFYVKWNGAKGWRHLSSDERQSAKATCMHWDYLEKGIQIVAGGVPGTTVYVTDPACVRAKVHAALFENQIGLPGGGSVNIGGAGAWQLAHDTVDSELTNALWEATLASVPVEKPCDRPARAVVGSGGGTVTTANGNGVDIPSAALGGLLEITVEEFDASVAPLAPQGEAIFGLAVDLGPDGQDFALPVSIILTYTEDDLNGTDPNTLRVWEYDMTSGVWQLLGGILDRVARTLTVEADHFSLYAIMGPAPGPVGGIAELPAVAGSSGSPAPNYAVMAGLVAVATGTLTAGAWYARRRWWG